MGRSDNIKEHDVILLQHELLEMDFICKGFSQSEAHNFANRKYNYAEHSDVYYQGLQMKTSSNKNMNSGAVKLLDYTTH